MKKKCKCDYTYTIEDDNILFIEDLNQGRMSVTNGIEDVLAEIAEKIDTNIQDCSVIYRDSDGMIDGVNTIRGEFSSFYHIGESELHAAILKIKES